MTDTGTVCHLSISKLVLVPKIILPDIRALHVRKLPEDFTYQHCGWISHLCQSECNSDVLHYHTTPELNALTHKKLSSI